MGELGLFGQIWDSHRGLDKYSFEMGYSHQHERKNGTGPPNPGSK